MRPYESVGIEATQPMNAASNERQTEIVSEAPTVKMFCISGTSYRSMSCSKTYSDGSHAPGHPRSKHASAHDDANRDAFLLASKWPQSAALLAFRSESKWTESIASRTLAGSSRDESLNSPPLSVVAGCKVFLQNGTMACKHENRNALAARRCTSKTAPLNLCWFFFGKMQ